MLTRIFWIDTSTPGRLAITARPRGGDWLVDEVAGWTAEGITTIVSLLEKAEADELNLNAEATSCAAQRIEFLHHPIADRGLPQSALEVQKLARHLTAKLVTGKSVAIHCRAGIGRSALAAAAVLIHLGLSADDAIERIRRARRVNVPDTDEQAEWIRKFQPE